MIHTYLTKLNGVILFYILYEIYNLVNIKLFSIEFGKVIYFVIFTSHVHNKVYPIVLSIVEDSQGYQNNHETIFFIDRQTFAYQVTTI